MQQFIQLLWPQQTSHSRRAAVDEGEKESIVHCGSYKDIAAVDEGRRLVYCGTSPTAAPYIQLKQALKRCSLSPFIRSLKKRTMSKLIFPYSAGGDKHLFFFYPAPSWCLGHQKRYSEVWSRIVACSTCMISTLLPHCVAILFTISNPLGGSIAYTTWEVCAV